MKICGLIDEYPIMRLGLRIFLEEHFKRIIFHSAKKINDLPKVNPGQSMDILLIGLNMDQKLNWLKQIEQFTTAYPLAALIIHAENLEARMVHYLSRHGVKGIVLKHNDPSELIECISAVQKGRRYLSPQIKQMILILAQENSTLQQHNNVGWPDRFHLTSHQYLLATFFAKGMKTSDIAKLLKLSASTISTTKAVILKKTKAANILELNNLLQHAKFKSKK
ncbi:LuxR C-terminal-related transcriptional regulator [Dyadobacter subterraneus]|uniref:Response regulator transcription factor n=1 Tax=Dyadobacter subterraneus TaxID=2773304 RepID=A0ABR9W536_9BACT|nr:response regulator transcription factor [Dyadobacter subterraneus]MBE9460572.1 response regulator transcription factor [Dyadobacter subterraneus]